MFYVCHTILFIAAPFHYINWKPCKCSGWVSRCVGILEYCAELFWTIHLFDSWVAGVSSELRLSQCTECDVFQSCVRINRDIRHLARCCLQSSMLKGMDGIKLQFFFFKLIMNWFNSSWFEIVQYWNISFWGFLFLLKVLSHSALAHLVSFLHQR